MGTTTKTLLALAAFTVGLAGGAEAQSVHVQGKDIVYRGSGPRSLIDPSTRKPVRGAHWDAVLTLTPDGPNKYQGAYQASTDTGCIAEARGLVTRVDRNRLTLVQNGIGGKVCRYDLVRKGDKITFRQAENYECTDNLPASCGFGQTVKLQR